MFLSLISPGPKSSKHKFALLLIQADAAQSQPTFSILTSLVHISKQEKTSKQMKNAVPEVIAKGGEGLVVFICFLFFQSCNTCIFI